MLDTLGILLSTAAIVWVVIRAVQLDKDRPWFDVSPDTDSPRPASRRPRPPGSSHR